MEDFANSVEAQTWTAPFDDTTRTFRRYEKSFLRRDDKYLVYYVQFVPPTNTVDMHLYLDLIVQGASWEFWAAFEAYLDVDGYGRTLLSQDSKETNVSVDEDRVRFNYTRDGYNGLYGGKLVRFLVRHGNERASLVPHPGDDPKHPFQMWVDQITP